MHGTGECKPCAWFHKAPGCMNGSTCMHCHLCPKDEIKERRKNKSAQFSQDGSERGAPQLAAWAAVRQGEALLASWQAQAMWSAAVAAASAFALASSPVVLDSSGLSAEASPFTPSGADSFEEHGTTSPGVVPSQGSALHASGQCKPCLWFWKPKGCQNGQECAYCHLCPGGELKERKKAKEPNLRTGCSKNRRPSDSEGSTAEPAAVAECAWGGSHRIVKLADALTA